MRSRKLSASNQQGQLPPTSQQQLAHLVAQLIQRVRITQKDKESDHER